MKAEPGESKSDKAKLFRQAAAYSGLAVAMPLATMIGYAAGRWLDSMAGTSFLWIVGLLLGIAAGFLQLIRLALRDSRSSTS